MKVSKWALLATGGLAVAAIVAVAALGGSVTQAQTPSDSGPKGAYDQALASQLGITVDQLQSARQAALDDVLNQAVTSGKITEQQAQAIRDHPFAARRGFLRNAAGKLRNAASNVLDTAATTIGVSGDELKTDLQNGQSLEQVASQHGVSTSDLEAALTNGVQAQLNQAVTAGTLSQSQADTILNAFAQHVSTLVQRTWPRFANNQ
jgi:hypothetical protein